jgi:hypothetical protein
MPKLTAQQKRDREFMELLDLELQAQKVQLGMMHAEDKANTAIKSHMDGWHNGYARAVTEFAQLTLWQRITWKANK